MFKTIHSKKLLAEQDKEKQIQNLSQTMAELNIIHPFREGNGRSTRELIRCMALEYGLHINWGNTDRETLINAAIAAVDDDMAFCDVLRQCIETDANKTWYINQKSSFYSNEIDAALFDYRVDGKYIGLIFSSWAQDDWYYLYNKSTHE